MAKRAISSLLLFVAVSVALAQTGGVGVGTVYKDGQFFVPTGMVISGAETIIGGTSPTGVTGKPYSVEALYENLNLDGAASTVETAALYRDKEGRTRPDVITFKNSNRATYHFTEILDPLKATDTFSIPTSPT